MNEAIRALQNEHDTKFLEAQALISKAEPTEAEQTSAAALIQDMHGIKNRIAVEFKAIENRDALAGIRTEREQSGDEKSFLWNGTKAGGDGASLMGMKAAGSVLIDSYGTPLADAGEGTFGAKAWGAMQDRDYKRGFVNFLRKKGNERAIGASQWKALQEGFDDQGGVFVPADSLMRIVGREPTPTRLAGMVTNLTTSRDRIQMPRKQYSADDLYSTAFRATWTGEIPSSDTVADVDDSNLLGNLEVPIFTAMLSASLTNDMVEDSAFPIQQWLENELRIVYELLRDNMILNGTGVGQPTGLLAGTGVNFPTDITTAGAGVIVGDDLFDTAYAIPEQYDDACTWVFNKTSTARAIAKLKDSQNRYLFGQGVMDNGIASARPKELIGYPYAYSGFMPNATTGNYAAIFGDMRGYYLVNRLGITLQVLRETKAKRNQFEIVARIRFGGRPVEPWKLRRLKIQ